MAEIVENKTFDEIEVGDAASLSRVLEEQDVDTWAAMTGNINPSLLHRALSADAMPDGAVGHGAWGAALFSTLIGMRLPGPGAVIRTSTVRFHQPIVVGAEVTATVTVAGKDAGDGTITLDCRCTDRRGTVLLSADVDVATPTKKVREPMAALPKVQLRREDRYLELLAACRDLQPIATVVAHPCSGDALEGPLRAAAEGLIDPILVGPEARIRAVADAEGLDISAFRLVPTEHSNASAERAVALVRSGEAEILMKGSLHTDELMREVMRKETGLRTGRRLSHAFLMAVPDRERPLIVTDAAINIYPTLEDKRDICQNAIELAHVVGLAEPRVAILSAVETVTPTIPSTIEAAALCKMADRGQIKGGLLDGPLAFDNAVDEDAARIKGIVSPVAGRADILLVPDLEAGNMLAKQLTFMGDAEAAGIVLGARVPIVLTSRADTVLTRLASCAVAALMVAAARGASAHSKIAE